MASLTKVYEAITEPSQMMPWRDPAASLRA
jgi:hypothetical protein